MNVVGFHGVQASVDGFRDFTAKAEVEPDGGPGRCRRDMDSFQVGEVLFVHSTFRVPEASSRSNLSVWDIWGKYDVNTLTFTDADGAVAWHPGPTVHVPTGSKITMVGPYEQVQHLQTDHGIIDRAATVKHRSAAAKRDDGSAPPA